MLIAENKLKEKNYVFHPKAKEIFGELVRKAYENRDKNFGNVLLVEKIVERSIRNMSERTMKIRQEPGIDPSGNYDNPERGYPGSYF